MAHDGSFSAPIALVIDDDPRSQRRTLRTLHELGLAPFAFGSAEDALAWMDAHGAPALVVTDVTLPRMSGFALCDAMRSAASTRAVPVAVVSGRRGMELEDHARALELDVELLASAKEVERFARDALDIAPAEAPAPLWARVFAFA